MRLPFMWLYCDLFEQPHVDAPVVKETKDFLFFAWIPEFDEYEPYKYMPEKRMQRFCMVKKDGRMGYEFVGDIDCAVNLEHRIYKK